MKIRLSLLEKFVELPAGEGHELRQLFDDLGLEVKDVAGEGADRVFTLETLAQRGDHLFALGIAREFAARSLSTIKQPQFSQDLSDRKPSFAVKNHTDKCYRYALLEMQVPPVMTLRDDIARVIGERDKDRHAMVDILNYIMLELGQPMHAFDRDKVEGEVSIVLSEQEEEIEALDGKRYKVPAGSILIRDRKKTIAVGGVIGCANSMCTVATKRVLIEAATFDPVCIRKTARAMGISTDASYLFERGADREMVLPALKRLLYLTSGVGSSESAHSLGYHYLAGPDWPARKIKLRIAQVRREMNLPRLPAMEVVTRLKYLGYLVETIDPDKEYNVTVPSWRWWNVFHESALIEDFARVHGVNRVKLELPFADCECVEPHRNETVLAAVEPVLLGNGFQEVITKAYYSAEDVQLVAALDAKLGAAHMALENALDRACSHLKVTNVLNLARVCERNHRQGISSCKVYEVGRLFEREEKTEATYAFERDVLSLAASGRWYLGDWRKPESIEELSRLFEGVLDSLGISLGVRFVVKPSSSALLHPRRQGVLSVGRTACGTFGVVHPLIAERLGLSREVLYAELDIEKLLKLLQPQKYGRPSDFPSIRKDITVKVPPDSWAGSVVKAVRELDTPDLTAVDIVDEFKKPEEDFRRISYRLTFQSTERTLEHAEVDDTFNRIISELKAQHGLELV